MSEIFTRTHRDPGERTITFERVQDVEPILERNKALQNEGQPWAGAWHHLGTIPNIVIEKWLNDEGANVFAMTSDEFGHFIKRKLRDPDNKWLRATPRRI